MSDPKKAAELVESWMNQPGDYDDRVMKEMEAMTADQLKEIKERCERATPGPWYWGAEGNLIQTSHITRDVWMVPMSQADKDLLAAARTDIPLLIAEVERLRAALEWYAGPECYRYVKINPGEVATYMGTPMVVADDGKRARDALKGEG